MLKSYNIQAERVSGLMEWMKESRAIYDKALYILRQAYFSSKDQGKIPTPTYNQLYTLMKDEQVYKASQMDAPVKAHIVRQASDSWLSFMKASASYRKCPDKFQGRPKMPGYLSRRGIDFNILTISRNRIRKKTIDYRNHTIGLPKLKGYTLHLPKQLDIDSIRQITVQMFFGKIKFNVIYEEKETKIEDLNCSSAIGIDIGLNNLCAITSNDKPLSYVVKGGPVKSLNQFYNKTLGRLKSDLERFNRGQKISKRIQNLNLKRRNKIEDYLHKASKRIIDLCVEQRIGRIVIGHNKGWKQEIELGKRTNQNFVSIPFNRLIYMIRYKGLEKRIEVETVEESYTSKVDHMGLEPLCKQEVYSGQRVKRGLFLSGTGKILNADINGAVGILRKANAILDEELLLLQDRGDVVSPGVLKV